MNSINFPSGRSKRRLVISALTGFLASNLLLAQPAMALDASDFIKDLQAKLSERGNSLAFQSMENDGSDGAILKQVTLEDGDTGTVIKIEELTLSGTEKLGANGYQFGEMRASDFTMTSIKNNNENVLKIGQIEVTDFSYPDLESRSHSFWPLNIGSGKFSDVRMDGKGKDQFSALFPSINLENLKSTGGNAFTLDAFDSKEATGSFINSENTEGTFVLGPISLENAAYFGGAGYSLSKIDLGAMIFDGTNEKNQKIRITYDGLDGSGLYSPDFGQDGDIAWSEDEMVFNSKGVLFNLDSKDVFSIKGANSVTHFDKGSEDFESVARVDDIFVNMDAIPVEPGQEASRKQFKDLGYSSINLDVDMKVGWNIESGILELEQYCFAAEDMLALDISAVMGGFTRDFTRQISKITNKMNAANDEIKQALAMQMLAMYSGITVNKLTIKVDDDSLTKRIMDQQAAKSGQEAKDLVVAMPFMAGAVLSQFNVPEFAASVSSAIGVFMNSALDNKGSLSVTANPAEPVSMAEIMGIGAGVQAGNVPPSDVIDRFGITIDAN